MRMRTLVRETMLELDSKGILQSIASKNDHDHAWRALELLGISSLFLYPRINWQPKSANIGAIVKDLNIGADSCAFVDDSGFERAEVASGVAGIRVYPETDIPDLIKRPEFDVPVTEESRRRREFYVAESARKQSAEGSSANYEEFLRSCQIEATIFQPSEPSHVERSLELLQRTNQLNLSTRRYSRTELDELLGDPDSVGICTQAMDRFGEYGIVGFASLKRSNSRLDLVDFVMSCRVAEKKLENAWFKWLSSAALSAGYDKVYARYVKTARNHVLLKAFTEAGFTEIEAEPTATVLALDCHVAPDLSDIVRNSNRSESRLLRRQ